jgi:hypothetical protein
VGIVIDLQVLVICFFANQFSLVRIYPIDITDQQIEIICIRLSYFSSYIYQPYFFFSSSLQMTDDDDHHLHKTKEH